MRELTTMQLYAEIRRLEATIRNYDSAGAVGHAGRARKELHAVQAELSRRIRVLVDTGARMPEHFTEVRA